MGYFKLTAPARINHYPFDYHSHFSGILAVHGGNGRSSLAGLLAEADYGGNQAKGELALFGMALDFMRDPDANPFARLLARTAAQRVQYERAECAAENIYAAAVLLGARDFLPRDIVAAPAHEPELFAAVREKVIDPALRAAGEADRDLLATARYFNGKVYSANKYTPFDDCYKMRSSFVKQFCGGDPARSRDWNGTQLQRYHAWIDATFDYLAQEGVTHAQTAATEDEMRVLAGRAAAYNRDNGTAYKLLVHTPHQYMPDGRLRAYLDGKVLPLLTDEGCVDVVGLDLLGAENKVGNYRELMEFLRDRRGELQRRFGPGEGRRASRMVVHVHCGEGSGFGSDNRSMIGYLLHEMGCPGEGFFAGLADYVLTCARAAGARRADTPRGTRGTHVPYGLFDELFRNNSLTWAGRMLRRFDISSERSREAAAFNAKRNVMALCETFDARPERDGDDWYWLLAEGDTPYAFRLGHAYYYRNYVAARYPQLAFDTNLGSNAITGASGLFGSIEGYRINRGFRHLDGYIDTNVLEAAGNAVAYMASEALTPAQVRLFVDLSALEQPMETVLEGARGEIEKQLQAALGPIYAEHFYYRKYRAIVLKLAARDVGDSAALRYQILARVLTLFCNWRSYLLGADGQGAEHTDIRLEFLRMCLLLAYGLLPTGHKEVGVDLLDELQGLLLEIGGRYWKTTIDPRVAFPILPSGVRLESFDGFKAPGSVATVRTAAAHD